MAVILIVLALLWFLVTGVSPSGGAEQTCIMPNTGPERCGPETFDGEYSLPNEGIVIRSVVNNGPLPPEYQEGFEIEIDAGGAVTITVLEGEADPAVRTDVIAIESIQTLLGELEQCQFYYLPQRAEFDDSALPVGGPVSILSVHLSNGEWESTGDTLSGQDLVSFDSCQSVLADRFDLEQEE